jgi:hypothetical protein
LIGRARTVYAESIFAMLDAGSVLAGLEGPAPLLLVVGPRLGGGWAELGGGKIRDENRVNESKSSTP